MSVKGLEGYAIITGAAGGIGRETALAFAEAGVAGILFADIDVEAAKEAAEASKKLATYAGYSALPIKVDVSDIDSVQSMVEVGKREFGRIDYCVNSAGIVGNNTSIVSDLDIAEFDRLHAVNARGTLLVTRAVSKAMTQQEEKQAPHRNGSRSIGRGVIVNVGSLFSFIAMPCHLPYVTAKHAVMGIVKAAALDLAPHGIRVNGILPSFTNTPIIAHARKHIPGLDEMTTDNPFKRPAESDEMADAIVYLCSPQATYITGSGLVVDAALTVSGPTG